MWSCIQEQEELAWCLEHGGSLATAGEQQHKRPILQAVAESGDIAVFKFLHSRKTPL